MFKTKESGHAKNVTNFQALITYCMELGAAYNPSNNAIKLAALSAVQSDSKTVLDNVVMYKAKYDHIINERAIAFEPVVAVIRRVIHALDASGASEEKVGDAKSILKKLIPAKKRKEKTNVNLENQEPSTKEHSNAHLTYDNKLMTIEALIQLLLTEPSYQPNEPELSITGLQSMMVVLNNKTQSVNQAYSMLNTMRIERDRIFYLAENNMCDLVQDVKKYIKSVFGVSSAQYKTVSRIKLLKTPTTI